ncbi:hypothetical protein ACU8KH_01323 [Lachancea thermotolerans]
MSLQVEKGHFNDFRLIGRIYIYLRKSGERASFYRDSLCLIGLTLETFEGLSVCIQERGPERDFSVQDVYQAKGPALLARKIWSSDTSKLRHRNGLATGSSLNSPIFPKTQSCCSSIIRGCTYYLCSW